MKKMGVKLCLKIQILKDLDTEVDSNQNEITKSEMS